MNSSDPEQNNRQLSLHSVLHPDSLYDMVRDQPVNRLAVYHRKTMSWISRAMELTALNVAAPVRIYSCFQSLQFFLPVLKRYQQLAQHAAVFVYGFPDVIPPSVPGITYVQLAPDDPLVKEWFIVVNGPDFYNALITEEISDQPKLPHARRAFKGLLTYDRTLVQQMDEALARQLGDVSPNPAGMAVLQRSLVMQMVGYLQEATRRENNDPNIARELSLVINQYISPTLT